MGLHTPASTGTVVVVVVVVVGATVELGDGSVVVDEVPEVHAAIRVRARTPANLPGHTR
jgi:serine acetyltransferase